MDNIPQPKSKPRFTKVDLWTSAGAVAVVWLVGLSVFDSWLTPLPKWLLSCTIASALLTFSVWLLRRVAWLAVCLLVLQLIAAFLLPAASRSSRVRIVNDSSDQLEVVIRDIESKRVKRLRMSPDAQTEFIYFVGDDGQDIQATMVISNPNKGFVYQHNLILTPQRRMNNIFISKLKPWLESGGGSHKR